MKTTTVEELLNPEETRDKKVIDRVSGKLTKLFDETSGEGAQGPYSFQNGEFMDATGKIKIVFANNSQPKSAKGKNITITSVETASHGLQGVKVEDNEYDGKKGHVKERILKITGSADVVYDDAPADKSEPKSESKPAAGSSKTQATTTHYDKPSGAPSVKQQYNDILAMYKQCYSDVQNMDTELAKNPQALCAAVATVFIECNKQSLSFDFQKRYCAKPQVVDEKNPWKYVKVPKGEFAGKTIDELPDDKLTALYLAYDEVGEFKTDFAKAIRDAYKAKIPMD